MLENKNAAKSRKLGMNFGTARARLERDLLFKMAEIAGHVCYRCGGKLERENFSIDHKENWSQAADPKLAFFDLQNVAFSHHVCNAAHTGRTKYTLEQAKQVALERSRLRRRTLYAPEDRHERYKLTGW